MDSCRYISIREPTQDCVCTNKLTGGVWRLERPTSLPRQLFLFPIVPTTAEEVLIVQAELCIGVFLQRCLTNAV